MKINNDLFVKNFPESGYNVYGGKIDNDIKKGFSFECGCGSIHYAQDAFAIREHKDEGTAIYSCPNNDFLLNLVQPKGFFRVKGIETIASFLSDTSNPIYSKIFAFQDMRNFGIKTLKEYYQEKY